MLCSFDAISHPLRHPLGLAGKTPEWSEKRDSLVVDRGTVGHPHADGFYHRELSPHFQCGFTKLIIVVLPEVIACVVTFLYFWLKKAWQTGDFSQVKKVSSTVAFLLLVATVVWLALY